MNKITGFPYIPLFYGKLQYPVSDEPLIILIIPYITCYERNQNSFLVIYSHSKHNIN